MESSTMQQHAVQIKRRYPAPIDRVFEALVNPEALVRWFAPNDEMTIDGKFDPTPGGRYRVAMKHMLGNTYTVGGVYETIDPPNKIVFTWQWENEPMSQLGESRVTIELKQIDGGTELTLTHDGFPAQDAADNHAEGWDGCLWRLERLFGSPALESFSLITALNRRLFTNALDGIESKDLGRRTSDLSNHMLWVAGHVANGREAMANLLGANIETRMDAFMEELDPDADYPGLSDIVEAHEAATHALLRRIPSADRDVLEAVAPMDFPVADGTILGAVSFFAEHEAYHVGQMGILRKQLGYPATSYDDRETPFAVAT